MRSFWKIAVRALGAWYGRAQLRWAISQLPHRYVDGLEITHLGDAEEQPIPLERTVLALELIASSDPIRYRKLLRYVRRILIVPDTQAAGFYEHALRMIGISEAVAASRSAEALAIVLVHEATHARLATAGIGPGHVNVQRMELLCSKQQLTFARTAGLPSWLVAWCEEQLELLNSPRAVSERSLARRLNQEYVLEHSGFSARVKRLVSRFAWREDE